MEIYLLEKGERIGPFTIEDISRRIQNNEARRSDMGWHAGMTSWKPLSEFSEFRDLFGSVDEQSPMPSPPPMPKALPPPPPPPPPPLLKYYYSDSGDVMGPVNLSELRTLLAGGRISSNVRVCQVGRDDWEPISTLPRAAFEARDVKDGAVRLAEKSERLLSKLNRWQFALGSVIVMGIASMNDSGESFVIAIITLAAFAALIYGRLSNAGASRRLAMFPGCCLGAFLVLAAISGGVGGDKGTAGAVILIFVFSGILIFSLAIALIPQTDYASVRRLDSAGKILAWFLGASAVFSLLVWSL